eukprot:3806919-Pleurochrysis_carterae.AAC.1
MREASSAARVLLSASRRRARPSRGRARTRRLVRTLGHGGLNARARAAALVLARRRPWLGSMACVPFCMWHRASVWRARRLRGLYSSSSSMCASRPRWLS